MYRDTRKQNSSNGGGDGEGAGAGDVLEKYQHDVYGGPNCSIKAEFFRPPIVNKELQKLRNIFKILDFKNGFLFLEAVDDWEDTGKLMIHESCCCKVIEDRESEVLEEIKRVEEDCFADEVYEDRDLEDTLLNMKF